MATWGNDNKPNLHHEPTPELFSRICGSAGGTGWQSPETDRTATGGGGLHKTTTSIISPSHRVPSSAGQFLPSLSNPSPNLLGAAPHLSEVRTRVPPIRGPYFFPFRFASILVLDVIVLWGAGGIRAGGAVSKLSAFHLDSVS